jgi:hypothetical protein
MYIFIYEIDQRGGVFGVTIPKKLGLLTRQKRCLNVMP